MPERRNLTEREIVVIEDVDLSTLDLSTDGAGAISPVIDAGGTGTGIGVPTNFKIISQEVVDFDGEYRVNVVIEFDGVAGAKDYESKLRQVTA